MQFRSLESDSQTISDVILIYASLFEFVGLSSIIVCFAFCRSVK